MDVVEPFKYQGRGADEPIPAHQVLPMIDHNGVRLSGIWALRAHTANHMCKTSIYPPTHPPMDSMVYQISIHRVDQSSNSMVLLEGFESETKGGGECNVLY